MKRLSCILLVLVLMLSGCASLVDTELDKSVKEMFIALTENNTEKVNSMMREDHLDFTEVEIEGKFLKYVILNRNTETKDGVTTKDARYQVTTSVDVKYVIMVRYIIDENEEGFYQYTIAKKDY